MTAEFRDFFESAKREATELRFVEGKVVQDFDVICLTNVSESAKLHLYN